MIDQDKVKKWQAELAEVQSEMKTENEDERLEGVLERLQNAHDELTGMLVHRRKNAFRSGKRSKKLKENRKAQDEENDSGSDTEDDE